MIIVNQILASRHGQLLDLEEIIQADQEEKESHHAYIADCH